MTISERPLLRGNVVTYPDIGDYKDLLTIESDPTSTLYVGHIRVDVDDTTCEPYVNVFLDGKQYLNNFLMIDSGLRIDFGKNLIMNRVKKPIIIKMKKTAAGAGTLTATAMVDGIEIKKH